MIEPNQFEQARVNPGLFLIFGSFITQILQKKTVGFSVIQTQIVGVQGESTDHLTTTAQARLFLIKIFD